MTHHASLPTWRPVVVALVAATALASCGGEPTRPGSTPAVQVSLQVSSTQGPTFSVEPDGSPSVQCDVGFSATAVGTGSATWSTGVLRIFIGPSRTVPVDSLAISAAEAAEVWQKPAIAAGETQQTGLSLRAGVPWAGELEFRYQSGGETRSSKAAFTCSPPIPVGAAAPSVTEFGITPTTGTLSIGTPLVVSWAASAPAGLWESVVVVSGPCAYQQHVPEQFAPSATHSISVTLPASCAVGVPLRVSLMVTDAALQVTTREIASPVVLADLTPPSFSPQVNSVSFGSRPLSSAAGAYFSGQAITISPFAFDNRALSAIIWEVLPYGVRDSVLVQGQADGGPVQVVMRPEWSGPIQLRMHARDAANLVSNVVTSAADSIRVYPTVDRPSRSGAISGQIRELAVDGARGVAYLMQQSPGQIAVVSLATLQVTETIALPANPIDMDLSPSGDTLLVAMFAQPLGIVDLRQSPRTLQLLTVPSLDATVGQSPWRIRALSNGHVFVATSANQPAGWTLLDVDLATRTQRIRTDVAVNGVIGSVAMGRSLDASVAAVNVTAGRCLRRYVVATDAFSACVTPLVSDREPALDATGSRIAIGTDVYDASLQLLPKTGRSMTPGVPYSVLSADGASLFEMLWTPGIVRVQAADATILDRTLIPVQVSQVPRLSRDGAFLVMLEGGNSSARLGVVELR